MFFISILFEHFSMNSPKGSGTQVDLKKLESVAYTVERKKRIVATLEKQRHLYLSIVVCRNPVEKLLSVFKVTQDPRVRREYTFITQLHQGSLFKLGLI